MTHLELSGAAFDKEARNAWMKMSRMQAKRKLGETITKEDRVSNRPPMKRIKTYITEMELNNMLTQT